MNFQLALGHEKKGRSSADGYIDAMRDLMGSDKTIVHLDCDLMDRSHVDRLSPVFPERVINVGAAEQNAMGVAAGMATSGLTPFVHSSACFASRRMLDQAYLSSGFSKLPVHVVGSDPGITAGLEGGSHMAFEDCALYMTIPDSIVIDPCDYVQTKALTEQLAGSENISYMRLMHDDCLEVYKDGSQFEIGKGVMLRDGTDVTIIASGIMVDEALQAAEQLEKTEGLQVRVIDMHTWKPLDKDIIMKALTETDAIVVAENHNKECGLGAAIEALIMDSGASIPVVRVGADGYGEVGMQKYLTHHINESGEEECEGESYDVKNGVTAAMVILSMLKHHQ